MIVSEAFQSFYVFFLFGLFEARLFVRTTSVVIGKRSSPGQDIKTSPCSLEQSSLVIRNIIETSGITRMDTWNAIGRASPELLFLFPPVERSAKRQRNAGVSHKLAVQRTLPRLLFDDHSYTGIAPPRCGAVACVHVHVACTRVVLG